MIATEGIHYEFIPRGGMRFLHFLPAGNNELDMFQRRFIENAFFTKKLGSSFEFHEKPEYKFTEPEDVPVGRIDTETDGGHTDEEYRIADAEYKARRYDEEFHGESRLGHLGYR